MQPTIDAAGVYAAALADGRNPFTALRQQIDNLVAPRTSTAFNVQTQVLRGIICGILALELAAFALKIRRGSYALFRLKLTRSGTFIVPTAMMWLVLFISTAPAMIVALTFGDQVYRQRQLDRIPLMAWFNVTCFEDLQKGVLMAGRTWLPFQLGAWSACWNLAVGALAPSDSIGSAHFVRTRWLGTAVNTLGIGFPVALLATLLPFLGRAQEAIGEASHAYVRLDRELAVAAAQSGPASLSGLLPLLPQALSLQAATAVYVDAVQIVDAVWAVWMSLHFVMMVVFVSLQIRRSRSQIDQLSRHRVIQRARATDRGDASSQDQTARLSITGSARDGDRLQQLIRSLRLVIAEAATMGCCATAFLVVLIYKLRHEMASITDRVTLETIRLTLFYAYATPSLVIAILVFVSCLTDKWAMAGPTTHQRSTATPSSSKSPYSPHKAVFDGEPTLPITTTFGVSFHAGDQSPVLDSERALKRPQPARELTW